MYNRTETIFARNDVAYASCICVIVVMLSFAVQAAAIPFFAPEPSREEFRTLVERAAAYRLSGDFEEAATAYSKAAQSKWVQSDEERARYLLHAAENHYMAEDYSESFTAYSTLINELPAHVPYEDALNQLRSIAEKFVTGQGVLFGFSNREAAIDVYTVILEVAPAGPRAAGDLLRLARIQTEAGHREQAVDTYRRLIREHPGRAETAEARLEMAEELFILGRKGAREQNLIQEARAVAESFLEHHTNHTRREDGMLLLSVIKEYQAEHLYELGSFYLNPAHRRQEAAKRYLSDLQDEFSGTVYAKLAAQKLNALKTTDEGSETTVEPREGVTGTQMEESQADSDLSPEKIKETKTADSIREEEEVSKWLLPIEDLDTER